MKLYEFQAKNILKNYGILVPQGKVISSSDDATEVFRKIGCASCVIKAQILAGGRGKSGGVQFVNTPSAAQTSASRMFGSSLVTHQTGLKGAEIKYLLIEEAVSIKKELYLAITIDRSLEMPVLITSTEGGMEIEEIAGHTPEKIIREPLDILFGIHPFQLRRIISKLGIPTKPSLKFTNLLIKLFDVFVKNDCSLLEINPLVITSSDELCALDAKIEIDDNALYRHPEFEQFTQYQEFSQAEVLARKYRLSYISLGGSIGCLVNGAGLAMATMDMIKLHGGEPANFLDVGGDASLEQIIQAFEIILSDYRVKAILVNIFGGIMKCDVIASGIIQAVKEVGIRVPLIVRLEGTNVDAARKLLNESGLNIIPAKDMKSAADAVVKASKNGYIDR
ncbi:MAG TPA: ADP-forming succinate--CoA ligase subunit beta [Candidatus Wujingus californicus]|uniref:ADP-forming succinate--CoA ligase subunit beta n=1 Tax=Candidatus Wujingus californicus TaxID=3367618 RepID=UPI001DDCBC17|nr:ADP-forming succinate--CoA ligase subunit beta [Planctomycetota bacterium]MDO8130717.1 ADP-forming succinate--CoA ligase subunit beta [Candidatus Brocadiales bacterium]